MIAFQAENDNAGAEVVAVAQPTFWGFVQQGPEWAVVRTTVVEGNPPKITHIFFGGSPHPIAQQLAASQAKAPAAAPRHRNSHLRVIK